MIQKNLLMRYLKVLIFVAPLLFFGLPSYASGVICKSAVEGSSTLSQNLSQQPNGLAFVNLVRKLGQKNFTSQHATELIESVGERRKKMTTPHEANVESPYIRTAVFDLAATELWIPTLRGFSQLFIKHGGEKAPVPELSGVRISPPKHATAEEVYGQVEFEIARNPEMQRLEAEHLALGNGNTSRETLAAMGKIRDQQAAIIQKIIDAQVGTQNAGKVTYTQLLSDRGGRYRHERALQTDPATESQVSRKEMVISRYNVLVLYKKSYPKEFDQIFKLMATDPAPFFAAFIAKHVDQRATARHSGVRVQEELNSAYLSKVGSSLHQQILVAFADFAAGLTVQRSDYPTMFSRSGLMASFPDFSFRLASMLLEGQDAPNMALTGKNSNEVRVFLKGDGVNEGLLF